ncbi:MAG: hypothetical protein LUH22_18080 [Bacteroides sp.]|nr:hypothetical protein [Bacteroides sp.]
MQVAWQLSKDERKLFNKRIKEYGRDLQIQLFLDQISKAKLIYEEAEFKIYKCKWHNIYFKNGYIQIFLDRNISTEDYYWEFSRKEWNLLAQEYFKNRRMDDIIVKIDNHNYITDIQGLNELETKVTIAEIHKKGTLEKRIEISSQQILKLIHNVAARNKCVHFLLNQNLRHNVIDIQELIEKYGSVRRDVSFLFPISDGKGNIYLIWESIEFEKSKATHIFKCKEEVLSNMEEKIKNFLEINYYARSRLNSLKAEEQEIKQNLQYYGRINHDSSEYEIWEERMKIEMPFLL